MRRQKRNMPIVDAKRVNSVCNATALLSLRNSPIRPFVFRPSCGIFTEVGVPVYVAARRPALMMMRRSRVT